MNIWIILLIVAVVAIIIGMPLLMLWSLHTVFGLAVTYDFAHWFAMFIIMLVFSGKYSNNKS